MSIRKAVSIALTRDPDSTEVYLVERSPELKFFGGYYAFPGGTLDEEDVEIEIKNAASITKKSWPFIVAAAREIFEETGILLSHGQSDVPKDKRQKYRQQLLTREIEFHQILRKENHTIDAADFRFIAAVVTPEFASVRYDTQFYWVKIPENQSPEILPGELVSGDFFTASRALSMWKSGEVLIVPPVIFMLQEFLGRSLKVGTRFIQEHARDYRKGAIHQIYFTPGIQMVPLQTKTLPPATHTNAYLVGESQLYIIDPAPSDLREQARFWNYLDKRLAEGRKFKAILLTHHHRDHVGALQECQKRYRLPIFAHRKTAEKLPAVDIDHYIEHGEALDLGDSPDGRSNWKLKAYHTPGHASGHLAFQESRYGAVIAGDMISTLSTIVINPPDGHMATYMRSLEFLDSVTTGMIYPSHGPAVSTGNQVLQYFIKHRQERERKLLEALSTHPQSSQELVPKIYDDVGTSLWPLAELSLRAGLIKLQEEGKCQQVGDKYRVSF